MGFAAVVGLVAETVAGTHLHPRVELVVAWVAALPTAEVVAVAFQTDFAEALQKDWAEMGQKDFAEAHQNQTDFAAEVQVRKDLNKSKFAKIQKKRCQLVHLSTQKTYIQQLS